MKRVYLASTFKMADWIPAVEGILKVAGWEIIDCWWLNDEKGNLPQDVRGFYGKPVVQAIAARHWQAIKDADALVLFAHPDEWTRFTGAAVEFGYAHALGKPVVVYGKAKLSAMWAPAIHCLSPAEFMQVMVDLNYDNERAQQAGEVED